jgi:hypothetical protein
MKYGLLHITESNIILTTSDPLYFGQLKLAHDYYKRFRIVLDKYKSELQLLEEVTKTPLEKIKFNLEFSILVLPYV